MFIVHIGAIDSFARGLKNAAKLIEDATLDSLVKERYKSYDGGIGAKIEKGTTSLEELEAFVVEHGEPKLISGKQEKCEAIVNFYV
ncbi:xylose isomerase-like [Montipora capricornis]|uniref:xylose isomerase-like n=1 Tax=Montipora capricornis TaxID=246305 RepID=UPI0035F208ED